MTQLGNIVALFADVHAEIRSLERALDQCRESNVETIVLLGDLFDRAEEADRCAEALAEWDVTGVYGNHEREIALAAAAGEIPLGEETILMLSRLRERIDVGDICLVHEEERWGRIDPIAKMFHRHVEPNGHHEARITFAGHTHFRSARDERGHLDITRGSLTLEDHRRYLINPGALAAGQFAIWNRETRVIEFHEIEDIRGGFVRP